MALDISKLENVKKAAGGKLTARCPACAAAGADNKGEHLVIYPDGKYGCAANPDDKAHRKEVFALAGQSTGGHVTGKISVNTFRVPESKVIMDLGRFGCFSAGSAGEKAKSAPVLEPSPACASDATQPTDSMPMQSADASIHAGNAEIREEEGDDVHDNSELSPPRRVGLDDKATGYGGAEGGATNEEEVLKFLGVTAEEFHGSN